ncbi:MAG: PAS domain S-box protein [Sphingobacteriia bacterium]|nr:MAG: PAS domain S-box protein [Sphingobacteriia bacterium]
MEKQIIDFANALINANGYYLTFVNMEGFYTYSNNHFNNIFIAQGDTVIGRPATYAVMEEDHEAMMEAVQKCIVEPGKGIQVSLRKPSLNSILTTQWEFTCNIDTAGNPNGIVCIGHDISECFQNQLKLNAILDSTVDSNILVGADYKIFNFNRAANEAAITISNKALLIGADIRDHIHPTVLPIFMSRFNSALNGKIIKSERTVQLNTGKEIWFEYLYYPVYDSQNLLVGVALNTTNIDIRKTAELKVLDQLKRFKKIAFLQSHELRAPLANIMGVVNVLNLLLPKTESSDTIELLNGLIENAKKMDSIVQQIVKGTRE